MKILMIAPEPFFEPRGTPIAVLERLRVLSELGHHINLVSYHVGEEITIPHVKLMIIPKMPFIKNVPIGPSFIKFFSMLFYQ